MKSNEEKGLTFSTDTNPYKAQVVLYPAVIGIKDVVCKHFLSNHSHSDVDINVGLYKTHINISTSS